MTASVSPHDAPEQMDTLDEYGKETLDAEHIRAIEKERRLLLKVALKGPLTILTTYTGTIVPHILRSFQFWSTILGYWLVRTLVRNDVLEDGPDCKYPIQLVQVSILGGFFSFALVFYASQSYSRYTTQYFASMSCEGRIFDSVTLAQATLPQTSCLRLLRYMNAAHVLAYIGLSSSYSVENLLDDWQKQYHLLTATEESRLKQFKLNHGGTAYREVLTWCVDLIEKEYKAGFITDMRCQQLQNQVLVLRDSIKTLYDFNDQPLPFFYVHLAYILVFFYLPLFTYAVAIDTTAKTDVDTYPEVIGCIIVLTNSLFMIGLINIGKKLQEPYGHDVEDLSVIHYLTFTLKMSRRIVARKIPPPTTAQEEEDMNNRRPELGMSYDGSFKFLNTEMRLQSSQEDGLNASQQEDVLTGSSARLGVSSARLTPN